MVKLSVKTATYTTTGVRICIGWFLAWETIIIIGQWLLLSLQSGCFQYRRFVFEIQSSAKIYNENITVNWGRDENKKGPRMAHLIKLNIIILKTDIGGGQCL